MTMGNCEKCSKNLKDDVYFKVCNCCKKNYCTNCGNKQTNFFGESSIKCIYILNKCFSCFILPDSDSDSDISNDNNNEIKENNIDNNIENNTKNNIENDNNDNKNSCDDEEYNWNDEWDYENSWDEDIDNENYNEYVLDDENDYSDYNNEENIKNRLDDSKILEYVLKQIKMTKEDVINDILEYKIL